MGYGRGRTPAAPLTPWGRFVTALNHMALPIRKCLDHRGPLSICTTDAVYFITVAAAERGTTTLADKADVVLSAARFYHTSERWFLFLFLIMPDHLHMLVHVPTALSLADVIGHWKSYLTTQHGIRFQKDFFDTRIRDREHFAEKWEYICRNPVTKGLVGTPREWPYSVAFDPATGQERPHRSKADGCAARPESAPYHDATVGDGLRPPRHRIQTKTVVGCDCAMRTGDST